MAKQFPDRQRFVSGMLQVTEPVRRGGRQRPARLLCGRCVILGGVQTVSMGRRFAALVIDWAVAVLSAAAVANTTVPPQGLRESLVVSGTFVVEVGLLVGLLGFSIGKRLVGLKVEGPDGLPIGVARALLRTFLLALVIPALVMNDERRGLHDIAARSREIRLER